jgi:hypothetical protein
LCINTRQKNENESVEQHLARLACSARRPRVCYLHVAHISAPQASAKRHLPSSTSHCLCYIAGLHTLLMRGEMIYGLCGQGTRDASRMEDDLHDVARPRWTRASLHPCSVKCLKYRTYTSLDWPDSVLYFASRHGTNFALRGGKTRLFHSGLSPRPAYLG